MVILEGGASRSNMERYFITFFDTVNNESRGVNTFPEANRCSKPLTLHFVDGTELPDYLKIMYKAV